MKTVKTAILAINGGENAVQAADGDTFTWPIVTEEDEAAVLDVLRTGRMSGHDVTLKLEEEFAAWLGTRYALGNSSGTASVHCAMYACGIGVGDEIIGPSLTFWASVLPALSLGASIVFADVDEQTLTLDPDDIEHRITDRTKAIVVVHLAGRPVEMDPIMEIANRHRVKIIEDCSQAHGSLYRGKKVGAIGHVAAFSCMSGKLLPMGEAGMLATDDREIYERAIAFGHYGRHITDGVLTFPELKRYARLPLGGYKYRMNQTCAAMGRVQLRHYDRRMAEIEKAMAYFWDLLEGTPGIRPRCPGSGSTMGGWFSPVGLYRPEELDGLPIAKFCEAVTAEGAPSRPGAGPVNNFPLHLHPVLHECDIYGHGKPTVIAHAVRDTRQGPDSLPVTERIFERFFTVPWFKRYRPEIIEQYANAFRKVCENAGEI